MELKKKSAEIFIPDNRSVNEALKSVTHVAIGAHQDDIEIMAYHGILECLNSNPAEFLGIICTNGAGSARVGPYASYSNEDMMRVRKQEQRQAATIGRFAACIQLDYSSAEMKDPGNFDVVNDLMTILSQTQVKRAYIHNLSDKHDTHVASASAAIQAMRKLPAEKRPKELFGCEVWRGLDWMMDEEKVALNVSGRQNLAAALLGVYDSQIAGGKRYDLATVGRRLANATYFSSHSVDDCEQLTFAMNLSPLINNPNIDVIKYISDSIDRFKEDAIAKISRRFNS